MTWKEKVICRILLLIAMMVAEDSVIKDELKNLRNHIDVNAPKPGDIYVYTNVNPTELDIP